MKKSGAPSGLNPTDQAGVVTALAKYFASWNEQELNKYYNEAQKILNNFPASETKEALALYIEYLLSRKK